MTKGYSEKNIEVLLSEEGAKARIRRSSKRYYVYGIYGGTLGLVYIGKGCDYRFAVHAYRARKFLEAHPNLPYEDMVYSGEILSRDKMFRLAAHMSYAPLRYKLFMFTNDEQKAFDYEKKLILRYGRTFKGSGVLSNRSKGAHGGGNLWLTEAHRQAVSKGRLASTKIKRVPVLVEGESYISIRDAATKTGINYHTICSRLKSKHFDYRRFS